MLTVALMKCDCTTGISGFRWTGPLDLKRKGWIKIESKATGSNVYQFFQLWFCFPVASFCCKHNEVDRNEFI